LSVGQVLHGRFGQERSLKGFNQPLRSTGSFVLSPGRGLIWRAEKPFAVVTVITPAGLVQEAGGTETLRLASARLPFLAKLYDMLSGALGGDWRGLESQMVVTRTGSDDQWEVKLKPRAGTDQTAMPFSLITLKGGLFVDEVRIDKADGDFDKLAFSDHKLGRALPPEDAKLLDQAAR
jgi:hypothetical protein